MAVTRLVLLLTVNEGLHSVGKGRVILLQVHYVKAVLMAFLDVVHWKEEPLTVVQGVVIEVQVQVVFKFLYSLDFPKVARLKLWVKKESFLVDLCDHKFFRFRLQLVKVVVYCDSLAFDRLLDELEYDGLCSTSQTTETYLLLWCALNLASCKNA
jgi:hypothetical protein